MPRDISFAKLKFVKEKMQHFICNIALHLKTYCASEAAATQLHLDSGKQIFGVLVVERQVGIARNTKGMTLLDGHTRKEATKIRAHHVLYGNEPQRIGQL